MSANGNSGWNRSAGNQPTKRNTKAPARWKGIAAGLAIVVPIIALCLWLFSGGEGKPTEAKEHKQSRIKAVQPAVASNAVKSVAKAEKTEEPAPKKDEPVPFKVITNGTMLVERFALPEGGYWERHRLAKPPLFKHATDDLLCMAVLTDGKNAMPPMPLTTITDEDFRNSLKDPIIINDDDEEKVKETKQAIINARQQVKEMMDSGLSFREILADHEKLLNENREIRDKAMAELQKIHEEGDTEGTRQYLMKINIAFQQMGIPELDEPKTREERMAERAAVRAENELTK